FHRGRPAAGRGRAGHAARPGPAGTGTTGGVRTHRGGVARLHARSPPAHLLNRCIRHPLRPVVLRGIERAGELPTGPARPAPHPRHHPREKGTPLTKGCPAVVDIAETATATSGHSLR